MAAIAVEISSTFGVGVGVVIGGNVTELLVGTQIASTAAPAEVGT
jgi:hypothetical protein